jgi:Fe-S cluster biogenesis protein NfuA
MQQTTDERELLSRLQQIDALIDQDADPNSQARLLEIVQTLLEFHKAGLQRILQRIEHSNGDAQQALHSLCQDTLVSNLLILHDLHPLNLEARIRGALDKCAPYMASHGGAVELLSISDDGAVHLRLEGSCHGCPSSRVTMQTSLEQEIYAAAPEVTSIEVEGLVEAPPAEPGGFVPIEKLFINGNAIHATAAS